MDSELRRKARDHFMDPDNPRYQKEIELSVNRSNQELTDVISVTGIVRYIRVKQVADELLRLYPTSVKLLGKDRKGHAVLFPRNIFWTRRRVKYVVHRVMSKY